MIGMICWPITFVLPSMYNELIAAMDSRVVSYNRVEECRGSFDVCGNGDGDDGDGDDIKSMSGELDD